MGYLLLTGDTGLVGRYLLRNLLAASVPVAAMGRPGKATGTLAGIMGYWEEQAGRSLPRPVIIEGDLNHPQIVPDAAQRQWLSRNCDTILHCAASMTFREDKKGEPFRTNVEGTKALLAMCQELRIRQWHHISTAYICGLRQGRILESDIDVGQMLGNVYEQSKLAAEKLVRAADFLTQKSFYRPASVVGDSNSGYVTSFHGFYLPLQLAHAMAGKVPVALMNERFFAQLGLKGHEGKNLVPVDWLSAAIVELVTRPECHGQTYHMASPTPVPVAEIQRVIRLAIEKHYPKPLATTISEEELAALDVMFVDYMRIYESHWRDDPKFDLTNTQRALPHLPCPDLRGEPLMRVSRYPVERNFVPPRHEKQPAEIDVPAHLQPLLAAGRVRTMAAGKVVGLQVNGAGGGQWQLQLDGDRLTGVEWGLPSGMGECFYLSAKTFKQLVKRELSISQSINSGRLVVDGAGGQLPQLIGVLEQVMSSSG